MKQETIRYYSVDLLWGQKLHQELRFVLVEITETQSILASTRLELEPPSIIRLYSYRFRIECAFREQKQRIGTFCYHFWSKRTPKLSHYQKAGEPGPLERVKDERSQRNILKAIRATGNRVLHGRVLYRYGNPPGHFRLFSWKTDFRSAPFPENAFPGKGVRECAYGPYAEIFFRFVEKQPELRITQIIQERQDTSGIYRDSLTS